MRTRKPLNEPLTTVTDYLLAQCLGHEECPVPHDALDAIAEDYARLRSAFDELLSEVKAIRTLAQNRDIAVPCLLVLARCDSAIENAEKDS